MFLSDEVKLDGLGYGRMFRHQRNGGRLQEVHAGRGGDIDSARMSSIRILTTSLAEKKFAARVVQVENYDRVDIQLKYNRRGRIEGIGIVLKQSEGTGSSRVLEFFRHRCGSLGECQLQCVCHLESVLLGVPQFCERLFKVEESAAGIRDIGQTGIGCPVQESALRIGGASQTRPIVDMSDLECERVVEYPKILL